jgi:hypothetical protein
MIHQMNTHGSGSDIKLYCTCVPTGILFIGDAAGISRNVVQHREFAKAEREHENAMRLSSEHSQYCSGPHGHLADPQTESDDEWLYGDSPAGLRQRAAQELAAEFGTAAEEWLV